MVTRRASSYHTDALPGVGRDSYAMERPVPDGAPENSEALGRGVDPSGCSTKKGAGEKPTVGNPLPTRDLRRPLRTSRSSEPDERHGGVVSPTAGSRPAGTQGRV